MYNCMSINLKTYVNLNETDKFLEKHNLPKQTQDKIGNLYSPTSAKKIKFIKKVPRKKDSKFR